MSAVYFIQPTGGGPVRVGLASNLDARISTLDAGHPQGLELLAHIDGGRQTEAVIHYVLSPWRLNKDWFRACPPIWRMLLDAIETGLSWLPPEVDYPLRDVASEMAFRARATAAFGSLDAAVAAMGVTSIQSAIETNHIRPGFHAVVVVEEMRKAGALPPYLITDLPPIHREARGLGARSNRGPA